MHTQHITRIRSSFAWIAPSADVFGELFVATSIRSIHPSAGYWRPRRARGGGS